MFGKRGTRVVCAIILVAASTSACRPSGPQQTEILWDVWGVPHIYGKSEEELFRAFGWAQARSHGDLILRLYGQARARGAEYWGEEYLDTDRYLLTMGVPARAQEWYQAQTPEFRRYLDAFADGINTYASEHPDEICDDVEAVLPVDGTDVLAHFQGAILFTFVTGPGWVANAQYQLESVGSNAWAIAPSRSASGNAMLLANPHLPWFDYFLFYEVQLVGPGIDVYGVTQVGFPALAIGFNNDLAWTRTLAGWADPQDLYHLDLVDGGYRWEGEVREFESAQHTIKVKLADGGFREEVLQVRRSLHGFVVAETDSSAAALRMVGLDRPGMLEAWWDMSRATSLREFEAVLQRMQSSLFTIMYADREGHIMHVFGGLTPVRPDGDWDWSRILPGDTSATLWTEVHPYEDLPRVLDPPSGWLQNANDPPWTSTFPRVLEPDDYPDYMAPRFMQFRAQRSARMLLEDDSITFDELVAYKHSTRVELADRILDEVLVAAGEHGSPRARRAAAVLEAWDRMTDAESRGGVLFEAFMMELWRSSDDPFAVPWNLQSALETPDGLGDPVAAAAALETAARDVEARYGTLDVPWGEVHRFRPIDTGHLPPGPFSFETRLVTSGDVDLPANGSYDDFGVFRAAWFDEAEDGRLVAWGGDTYVAAIEFSDPIRVMAVLGYGNSSQPGSPHLGDQLHLLARKQLRPVWRSREDIEDHLSLRTAFE